MNGRSIQYASGCKNPVEEGSEVRSEWMRREFLRRQYLSHKAIVGQKVGGRPLTST